MHCNPLGTFLFYSLFLTITDYKIARLDRLVANFLVYVKMNISLSDKHRRNLEEIAKEEKVRTADAIRAIFELGLKEWELRKALRLYREGKTTLWKAAEIAELTLHELIDIIDREGIPYDYDVDATLDYVRRLKEKDDR